MFADKMKKTILILAAIFLFGAALGYLGGFIEFWNETHHGASYVNWEYEWFALPALPGRLISAIVRPFDYQLAEHWIIGKHITAFWNGLIFTVLAFPIAVKKRTNRCTSNSASALPRVASSSEL